MKAKEFVLENKKDRRAKKYNIKPRNPMGTAPQTGAGAHKDKKKAEKQGDIKHKGKQYNEGVAEAEEDIVAVIDGVRSDRTYNDKDHAHNSLGKLVAYGKAKIAELYINGEKVEHFEIGKKYIDFEPKKLDADMAEAGYWYGGASHKPGWSGSGRRRDPEDWDEGNTEPPNNMAIYINGKLWKVFQGNGTYADDAREMAQYRKLQDWARRKSQETGKKWEVSRTGAPATESMEEGWKEKIAATALAGSMALGAGSAGARTLGSEDPGINRLTGQPVATQVVPSTKDQSADKETVGFSTEYLKKVADGKHPRPMISVDDAKKELSKRGELKNESIDIPFNQCPNCRGPIFHESFMNEKQDACYHKVRSRYKVWPSAYASGALVQCRKKGAKNWGNKSK